MEVLIERIRERLALGAYANEAAISHGIVTPILNALGWDSADPDQLVPEHAISGRGRVDFALLGRGRTPAVFIEVKGIGLAVDGDRQLFEYAFHEGVPLCVLTDGREWSFYLPSGQGSYDDRRVYRLQLDDRHPAECERILTRYLAQGRVRDQSAFEDARADHRDAAGKRDARGSLPKAWRELIAEQSQLIDLLVDRTEAVCGYRPSSEDVLTFLKGLTTGDDGLARAPRLKSRALPLVPAGHQTTETPPQTSSGDRTITYQLFGQQRSAPNASIALADVLRSLASRDPSKLLTLAERVRTPKRANIATSPAEISPGRPDLARAAVIIPGWLVGLNISNRQKMGIIRAAAEVYGVSMPGDLSIELPNG